MKIQSIFFQKIFQNNSSSWPFRPPVHHEIPPLTKGDFLSSLWTIQRGMALTSVVMAMVIFNPGEAFPLFGFSEEESKPKKSAPAIPPEYQNKKMPSEWLTDSKVIAAGKAIYEGKTNPKVKCAGCHGEDGKPTRKGRGAPDFSDPSEAQDSDAEWFWLISEGKRRTKMRAHKKHLTEEQRWQVIAYMRTFVKDNK